MNTVFSPCVCKREREGEMRGKREIIHNFASPVLSQVNKSSFYKVRLFRSDQAIISY